MENNPVSSQALLFGDEIPIISPSLESFNSPFRNEELVERLIAGANGVLDTEAKMKGFVERIRKTVNGSEQIRHVVGLKELQYSITDAIVSPQCLRIHPDLTTQAILVAGPPGCAKTTMLLQSAVLSARQLGKSITYFQVSYSDTLHAYVGESEKFIKILYETAKSHSPSIILLDEAEGLMKKRKDGDPDHTSRFKSALLSQIQGYSDNSGVLLLATTNAPYTMDDGYQRRFQERFLIRLPSRDDRALIFDHFVGLCETTGTVDWDTFDFKKLAARSNQFSGDDIRNCVARALRKKFIEGRRRNRAGNQLSLNMDDVMDALKESKPSCEMENIRKLEKWGIKMATNKEYTGTKVSKSNKWKITKALQCVFMGCFCGSACGA